MEVKMVTLCRVCALQFATSRAFSAPVRTGEVCARLPKAIERSLARWVSDDRTPWFHFQSKGLDREKILRTDDIEDRDRAGSAGPRPAILDRIRARATDCR